MKYRWLGLLMSMMLLLPANTWAVTCAELDNNEKIVEFSKKAREHNPLFRKQISSMLDIKTTEEGKKAKSMLHNLRMDERKRTYVVKGKDAPMCMVTVGSRDFKCNECTQLTNSQCRSYKSDENSTTIQGTNIDKKDVELMEDPNFQSKCVDDPEQPDYIKIESTRIGGDSPYDSIESYYDKEKEVNISMSFLADKILRKVYRYFPKYYIQIEGEWMSTVSWVRTVKGREDQPTFETMIVVKKDDSKKYMIYNDPKTDPILKGLDFGTVYNTN
ncbi:MAG: hypothetical protein HQM12_19350 [SAR324 cluster bacterium]|nr:hypothetical protein [SAR324 cluster bacterium]